MKRLVLSGGPRERGQLHGKTWPQEIHGLATDRKCLLKAALNWSDEKIAKLADEHLKILKQDSELWEEFCGIAEAAQISHVDLMILNNHTDLRDFGESDFDESLLECSCFAFKQGSQILAGQTWDMHGSAKAYVAHLTIKKDNQTQEIFTLTGCLGLTGVTSNSFGVFINNLRSREVKFGYAWPAVVRKLLDCKTIAEGEQTVKKFMPSAGRNFMLVDAQDAINLEVTGLQTQRQGDLSAGYLFHTNHYLSDLRNTEEASTRSKTTLNRYAYLEKLAPQIAQEKLEINHVAQRIFNETEGTLSIPLSTTDRHASATCGGLVYDYQSKKGVSFEGLYSANDHFNF